jgi:hypothetical protein
MVDKRTLKKWHRDSTGLLLQLWKILKPLPLTWTMEVQSRSWATVKEEKCLRRKRRGRR